MKIMHDDKKINAMQDQGAENATDISALQEAVGDEDGGLIKAVADLQTEKTTLSDVETLLASGDVEDIKGDSIIENMTGYSFTKATTTKGTLTYIYSGVVKNGNKITFVNFVSFAKTAGEGGALNLGIFTIPSAVGSKLFPYSGSVLDMRNITAWINAQNITTLPHVIYKNSNTAISFEVNAIDSLSAGFTYLVRVEATFLLSDNLAA